MTYRSSELNLDILMEPYPVECPAWVQSPTRTVLESLVCIGLVASYIPQYLRIVSQGTFGLSSWTILLSALFATSQLASRFANYIAKIPFDCVNEGHLRGLKAFSALLGFIQAIVQWFCAMILVVLYINYRSDAPPISYDRPPSRAGITTRNISSAKLKITILVHAFTLLPVALAFLWRPDLIEDNFGLDTILLILSFTFDGLLACASILLAISQYVPQILTTLSLRTRGSISIVALGVQIIMFVLLSVVQFLRIGIPTFGSPPERHGILQSYFDFGHMSVNYLFTAVGQLALLIVCLIVEWGHLAGSDKGSLKLVNGEDEPLVLVV